MNLTESLRNLYDKLKSYTIVEDKGHLDHPEDLIFLGGTQGTTRAINGIVNTVKNPKAITIKWDGYPALIFGRDMKGRFSIMDKHMFNKKDGTGRQVFSPQQFVQYDQARGVDRAELHQIIAQIWPGLEKSDNSKGYYWGDLLFTKPLKPQQDGLYHFRANPNGIAYTVDPNSEIGKELTGKQAGIVVHGYLPAEAITKYGPAVDQLLSTAPQAASAFSTLFTVYINKRIVSRNLKDLYKGFFEFFNSRPMTESMRAKLTQHFEENKEGVYGAFVIWTALYNLKMDIVNQLNKAAESAPVQGYLQDGTRTQEGFVSQGLKFVDRMGFSAQNLAARG